MIYGTEEFDEILIKIIKAPKDEAGYRHPCYEDSCAHAEEMSWHLYGTKPEALLSSARPREDPEVTAYRLKNYQPTTKSAADKAINIVSKIFNPNLYSIRWEKQSESQKKLKEYTLDYYPEYNSVVNYTKDVLLRKMLADPNGVVAIKLENIPEKTSEEIVPSLVVYGSSAVWNYDYDHFLIHLKTEEIKVGQKRITWFYFEYYDNANYIEFRAYVTPNDKLIVEDLKNYPHGFTEIPAWKLQGKSESKDTGEIMYKSFFDSAVPYWNYSIIHESDVLGAYINHMHPLRVELSEECNYLWEGRFKCARGIIKLDTGSTMACPHCEGSGYKPAGPYGVFKVSKKKLEGGDGFSPAEAVSYVNIPVDATKMLEERAHKMRQMGMWAINMDVEDKVGENQSGVAKVVDRSAQFDTLYNIGSVIFDVHLQNIFYFFNLYMFGVSDKSVGKDPESNLPEINKPTQFDIASTAELVANYKVAKDSGLDANFLQIKQIEIGTRDLTTNPDLKKFTNLLLDLDPLPGMDATMISLNVSKLFIRQVDAVIHNNIKRFLERAIEEDPKFFEKKRSEQKLKLEEYGQEMITENKPKIDPTILEYVKNEKKAAAHGAIA
jgi:hypothetical protein